MDKWLIKNATLLSTISVFVAVISCIKEIVFVRLFGVSSTADAYTIATTLPEVLFAVVWNAMNAILIPMYQKKLLVEGRKSACKFISLIISTITIGSILFVILSEIITDFWIYIFAPGFNIETHNIAVSIARLLFPILIFEGIERVNFCVLQANKKFFAVKIIPVVRNIFVICLLFVSVSKHGIFTVAFGLLLGIIIETIIAFCYSRKFEKYIFAIDLNDTSLHNAGRLAIPIIFGTGISELNIFIDKVTASFLETGSIVSLSYASRMEGIITTILLLNVVSIAFPLFAEYVANNEIDNLKDLYEKTLCILLVVSVPIVIGAFVFGKDIISIVFFRSVFDDRSISLIGSLFCVYMLAALFNTIRTLTANIYAAYGETTQIMTNTIFSVILNGILNILLSYYYGAIGIVVATFLSSFIASLRLVYFINKSKFIINFSKINILFIKVVVSSCVMGCIVFTFKNFIERMINDEAFVFKVILICLLIGLGTIIYFSLLLFFGVHYVKNILLYIKNKLKTYWL